MTKTKLARWLLYGLSIFLLVLMLPGQALAEGGETGKTVTIGGYQVSLVFPEPLRLGENSVHLKIQDAMGSPVSGAQVEISALAVENSQQHQQAMNTEMPAAGGMVGMGQVTPMPSQVSSGDMPGLNETTLSPTPAPTDDMAGMNDVNPVPSLVPTDEMAGMAGMDTTPIPVPTGGMPGMQGMDPVSTQVPTLIPTQVLTQVPTQMPTQMPTGDMPGMGSAAAQESSSALETQRTRLAAGDKAGEYTGKITFSTAGHWMLSANIKQNDEMLVADFPLDVPASSAGLMVLSGFAGFNIVIIGVAALMKRRPISA